MLQFGVSVTLLFEQQEHNDIAHTANGGIVLGYGFGIPSCMEANTIRNNRISHSEAVLYDTGSVYTLGGQPRSEINGNLIVDQILLFGSLYHVRASPFPGSVSF